MSRQVLKQSAAVVLVSLAFGVTLSVMKGNGSGVRDALGNISAPWLLLPFVAGALLARGRPVVGAVTGIVVTLIALAAFYVTNAIVLDLGTHSFAEDIRLTVKAGQRYFALALLSGPTFGALGGWWQRKRSTVLAVVVTSLLVFEPFAWIGYERLSRARFDSPYAVWVGEAVAGLVACALVGVGSTRANELRGSAAA